MNQKSSMHLIPGAMLFVLLTACGSGSSSIPPPSYNPVGPQVNVPVATVTAGGWTVCHTDTYDLGTASLTTVLATCNKARLMLACRPVGDANFTLLAHAPRADVTFVTPNDSSTVHSANGSDWYYSTDWSWGFAKQGDIVNKSECDVDTSGANDQRLCWHTVQNPGFISPGYRCGATQGLNSDNTWERVILHAN